MESKLFQQIQASTCWEEQLALLEEMGTTENTARLLNCQKNTCVIKDILANPRSKVITSTIEFLVQIFEMYGPLLHNFALNIMSSDCLFKLLNSANKVISSHANQLFKAIIVNSPHSKFYPLLIHQFSSKNHQVRQFISSYFLVLTDMIQFPPNFSAQLSKWSKEPNKNVRANLTKLKQIVDLHNMQTAKQSQKQNISKPSIAHQPHKRKQSEQENQSHSKKQFIIQSFIDNSSSINEITNHKNNSGNIEFLLSKIKSNEECWNFRFIAIEELCALLCEYSIPHEFYLQCFEVIVELLDERRNKVYLMVYEALQKMIEESHEGRESVSWDLWSALMVKSVKTEQIGYQILPTIVRMSTNPVKHILHICQLSLEVKPIKQKIILLDVLVECVCEYNVGESKVSPIVKILCRHLQKHHQNKDIYLPCMAVISQFKSLFASELLSCLLCQGNEILTKIITIADEIDPSLREAILAYIHGMKGDAKNEENSNSNKMKQKKQHKYECRSQQQSGQLQKLAAIISKIKQQQQDSVDDLAQIVFSAFGEMSPQHFLSIIKLTEQVVSETVLLELELLCEQMCKIETSAYLEALFMAVSSCNSNSIESEYVVSYLQKVLAIFTKFERLIKVEHAERLIAVYRYSKCPKVRMTCIKILGIMPLKYLQSCANKKQMELIQTQVQHFAPSGSLGNLGSRSQQLDSKQY